MNKIWLIIKREYLTRVKKKTFILSTFLTPLLFAGVIFVVILITVKNVQEEKIAVRDGSGIYKNKLVGGKQVKFEFVDDVDTANFASKGYAGVLFAPHTGINTTEDFHIYSKKSLSLSVETNIDREVTKAIENKLLDSLYNIQLSSLDSVREQARAVEVRPYLTGEGSSAKQSNSGVAYGVGYGAAFLIYITLFVYGAMVMRGVSEEKTNRIAEIMVSSVKPFQLMIGKIVGIGAVGLTQFLMWIILVTVFSGIMNAFIPDEVMEQVRNGSAPIGGGTAQFSETAVNMAKTVNAFSTVDWWLIIPCFLFYFLFGYLFYASLFAAVGSAVNEDPQDAQSLMFPITMPIVIAIIIMINAITNPTSSLAIWSSIIPFFSPVVMMARLPFGVPGTVPWWELGLSMFFLVAGFLFTTWLSAKIYRTGILMYGKKASWKEMLKWAFRKS
jgi:ABC-2 type transport system permease protein